MQQPKKLYGCDVCKKCSSKFANRRQFAFFLDMVFVRIASFAVAAILGILVATQEAAEPIAVFLFLLYILAILAKDGFSGTSPGKALMGVQAIDQESRKPIGFGASIKRNLPTLIPIVPLVIAVQLIKGKRLGDGWAGTQVIWRKYADNPVFTGKPLPVDSEFGPAQVNLPPLQESSNPYQSPRQ